MGGSRRRLKRNAPKVKVGVIKRKKTERTRVPLEVTEQRTDIQKKLHTDITWELEQTLNRNYEANQLVADPNYGVGCRSANITVLKSKEEREAAGEQCFDDDDELRAGCNLVRSSGPAEPPRLTSQQKAVITALIAKHGEDTRAMMMDRKVNKMQHSEGHLKKMIESLHFWTGGKGDRHDFRAPRKKPKKLF